MYWSRVTHPQCFGWSKRAVRTLLLCLQEKNPPRAGLLPNLPIELHHAILSFIERYGIGAPPADLRPDALRAAGGVVADTFRDA